MSKSAAEKRADVEKRVLWALANGRPISEAGVTGNWSINFGRPGDDWLMEVDGTTPEEVEKALATNPKYFATPAPVWQAGESADTILERVNREIAAMATAPAAVPPSAPTTPKN